MLFNVFTLYCFVNYKPIALTYLYSTTLAILFKYPDATIGMALF